MNKVSIVSAIVIICLFVAIPGLADQEKQMTVVENFLQYKGSSASIISVQELKTNLLDSSAAPILIGWVMELKPSGYLLVSASTEHMPIKAYSLTKGYQSLPPAYRKFLEKELELHIRAQADSKSIMSLAAETPAQKAWDFLLHYEPQIRVQSYQVSPLLSTAWNQGAPFNSFLPEIDGKNVLTGCVNTALAQVMRYYEYPAYGNGTVSSSWNGQTLTAVLHRPYIWHNMPKSAGLSDPGYEKDEIGLLFRDLCILNQTNFGRSVSSASFHSQAFAEHFGYSDQIVSMDSSNSSFYATLKSEIDVQRPVLLALPGHMAVVDGYKDDLTGNWFHINMGWGGHDNDYYNMDKTVATSSYTFSPDYTIYYNIKPCTGVDCAAPEPPSADMPPQILNSFQDLIIKGDQSQSAQIRIDARDPNNDPLSLSLDNTNPEAVNATLTDYILSLQPQSSKSGQTAFITLKASSDGDSDQASFRVFLTDQQLAFGQDFDLSGVFSGQDEVDSYLVYLEGNCSISGDRGYSNQAFYLRVEDDVGNVVIDFSDAPLEMSFSPGFYTVKASLNSGSAYYTYAPGDHDQYAIRFSCPQYQETAAQLAIMLTNTTGSPPAADAGYDQNVSEESKVILDGSNSIDPENDIVKYKWSQISGPDVVLSNDTGIQPTFTAPNVGTQGATLVFSLTVTDMNGLTDTTTCSVKVEDAPVAMGDVDGNGAIRLRDAIVAMQLSCGLLSDQEVHLSADVNNDDRIGLAEALYALRQGSTGR